MKFSLITMAATSSTNYEQMANTFKTVSIVLFALAAVCLVLGIIMFFAFNIPNVIGELSGRNARKEFEHMREVNEKDGNNSLRPDSMTIDRETLTEQIKESKKLSKNATPMQGENPKPIMSAGNRATDVLEDVNTTVILNYDQNGTEILNKGTQVLSNEEIQSALNKTTVSFKMIQNIVLIHTDEVI